MISRTAVQRSSLALNIVEQPSKLGVTATPLESTWRRGGNANPSPEDSLAPMFEHGPSAVEERRVWASNFSQTMDTFSHASVLDKDRRPPRPRSLFEGEDRPNFASSSVLAAAFHHLPRSYSSLSPPPPPTSLSTSHPPSPSPFPLFLLLSF